jgi:single-strand DNA-binding protein
MGINRTSVTGELINDPVLKKTIGGSTYMVLELVVRERRYNSLDGKWNEYSTNIIGKMYGTRVEKICTILKKNTKVTIDGKLRGTVKETIDGVKYNTLDVVVEEIEYWRNSGHRSTTDRSL